MATHRKRAWCAYVRIDCDGQRCFVLDADCEVNPRARAEHVFRDRNEIASSNITAAKAGRTAEELGNAIDLGVAGSSRNGVSECRLGFAEQRIGSHHWDV